MLKQEGEVMDYIEACGFAVALVEVTKKAVEAFERSDFTVARKADNSPVTMIDEVTQSYVVDLCRRFFGDDVVIIAEESGFDKAPEVETSSPWTIFIDPIDGTVSLCAGDLSAANISVGVYYKGRPYVGFVGQLSTSTVMFGGMTIGGLYQATPDGNVSPLSRKTVTPSNKLWGFEIGKVSWADTIHRQTLLNLFDAHDMMGGKHYCLPCVAAGIKVIFGHSSFFLGVQNARSWDVAALIPMVEVIGGSVVALKTGEPIRLDNTPQYMPSFIVADSAASIEYVMRHRP